jgi:hypothetical protein
MRTRFKSAVAANKVRKVSVAVHGRKPGHTYHFRLVAISSAGPSYGPDETFKTAP